MYVFAAFLPWFMVRSSEILQTEHVKRTFDYEPFIQTFVTKLHEEGVLEPILAGPGKEPATEPAEKPRLQKKAT